MNSGDVFVNPNNGHETFNVAPSLRTGSRRYHNDELVGVGKASLPNRPPPVLNLISDKGTVTVTLAAAATEANAASGNAPSTDDESNLL